MRMFTTTIIFYFILHVEMDISPSIKQTRNEQCIVIILLRLEELYSYTGKNQQQKQGNKTKQRITMYSEQLYTKNISVSNKSIQAVQLI